MTPGRGRVVLPPAVIGLVIALCAVLLLKWLALVALVAAGVVLLVGRVLGGRSTGGVLSARTARTETDATPVDPRDVVVPTRPREPRPSPDDCSWCGLPGGHRTVDGTLRVPRHVHAAR